jgi:hypothetical protein
MYGCNVYFINRFINCGEHCPQRTRIFANADVSPLRNSADYSSMTEKSCDSSRANPAAPI